ncbi:MAG: hypothetical protein ACTSWP_05420 [Candidatus Freyarchaeota archaeon]|nr:hypothetical protein [Candidatus Freyrarchaeum guaymaensis]
MTGIEEREEGVLGFARCIAVTLHRRKRRITCLMMVADGAALFAEDARL